MRGILQTRRKALVALAERLIEKEVIDNDELKQIIEANSPERHDRPRHGRTAGRSPGRRTPRAAASEARKVEGG